MKTTTSFLSLLENKTAKNEKSNFIIINEYAGNVVMGTAGAYRGVERSEGRGGPGGGTN